MGSKNSQDEGKRRGGILKQKNMHEVGLFLLQRYILNKRELFSEADLLLVILPLVERQKESIHAVKLHL